MANGPRTKVEFDWAMYEFDQYGGKRPQSPTVTELAAWAAAPPTPAEVLGITTQPEPAVADTPKKPRAKPMVGTTPRSKNSIPRLQGELFGIPPVEYGPYIPPVPEVGPVPTMGGSFLDMEQASGNNGQYLRGTPTHKSGAVLLAQEGAYFGQPGDLQWNRMADSTETGRSYAGDQPYQQRMAADALAKKLAAEAAEQARYAGLWNPDPDGDLMAAQTAQREASRPIPITRDVPTMGYHQWQFEDTKLPGGWTALGDNLAQGGLPGSGASAIVGDYIRSLPTANTDVLGIQTAVPGPQNLGRSGASTNAETFGVRSPIAATHHLGRSGSAANQPRMSAPSAGLAALGISAPQGGGGGTLARPSYPVALDRPGMVLNRPALGYGGMEFVERVPPAALGAPPVQPPPPGLMARAGSALSAGAYRAGSALGVLGTAADLFYTPQGDIDILETAARQGRGRDMPVPVRAAPAQPYVARGEAQFGRGDGFVDPRLIRAGAPTPVMAPPPLYQSMSPANMGPQARPLAAPVRRPVRAGPVASPWVPMAMDPSVMMQTPVVSSPLPVGNANIDDETRRRAYRAMGLLP